MSNIIYSAAVSDFKGNQLSQSVCKDIFKDAIDIHEQLVANQKKIAYFFIDPLLNNFEAANRFYFSLLDCDSIGKMNTYKSGASPIQALADAKELLTCRLYDAVYIFGYEPLQTNKLLYGKEAITDAMNIFDDYSIIQCYNEIARHMCKELAISETDFIELSDQLYTNYANTYTRVTGTEVSRDRGRVLADHQADLFKLTDCANPNIDFAGGIIVATDDTADLLQIPKNDRIKAAGVSYSIVEGSPEKIEKIVGEKGNIFPHLRQAFLEAQAESAINLLEQFQKGNVCLESYTCYPPVPMAFLLATGLIENIKEMPAFLGHHDITITGGMNVARAPWNNPALYGIISMHQKLKETSADYGLVHGNGGIGEVQGVAFFSKRY